ncbi:MAG: AzlD domain-containing protein [Deltaproteobacteria bacterium]|jgi:branched-subunit amino acid transport protein|nr:AzlD domain-containing protein [Deltaproteobacteria bacterium]
MTPNFYLALALAIVGTQLLRLVFLAGRAPLKPPAFLAGALEFLPSSILAALVFQGFFLGEGPLWPRLSAGLAALILAWTLGKDLLTIGVGLGLFWLLSLWA